MRFRSGLRTFTMAGALAALAACSDRPTAPGGEPSLARDGSDANRMMAVNVLTKSAITDATLAQLEAYGSVFDVMTEINAVIMLAKADQLTAIRALPAVASAEPDAVVTLDVPEAAPLTSFTGGMSMWNLDAVNVTTGPGVNTRAVSETGKGVYVGVLDSGLLPTWRSYFPAERIATQYATSFVGGGAAAMGATPSPPDWWENDQNTHGTHVTSTILGFNLLGTPVTGVAPEATVIPVKVLNQSGSGWWSAIAQGVLHIVRVKKELGGAPMVINMSLGGGPGTPTQPVLKAAIDHAIKSGVLVVAAAGNSGTAGMGAPGSYAPVISVASVGWVKQYTSATWWYAADFIDPTLASEFFVSGSSGRAKAGQDLDLAAPGVSILGPAQTDAAHLQYQFFGGTSMATPHVAGTVALMLQRKPGLAQADAEKILEASALFLPEAVAPKCPTISQGAGFPTIQRCWGKDATGKGVLQVNKALAAVK